MSVGVRASFATAWRRVSLPLAAAETEIGTLLLDVLRAHDIANVVEHKSADEAWCALILLQHVHETEPDHGGEREAHANGEVNVNERHRVRLHGHVVAQAQLEHRERQHDADADLHLLRKGYEERGEREYAEHDGGYDTILDDEERLALYENLVANLGEGVVLDPVGVLDLVAEGLVAHQGPLVVLGVVLERGILIHERVVEVVKCVAPAAEHNLTQLVVERKLLIHHF